MSSALSLLHHSGDLFSVIGKPLDGVLGVIVIPGYLVVVDEGEQLILVLGQPLPQRLGGVGAEALFGQQPEVSRHGTGVFL